MIATDKAEKDTNHKPANMIPQNFISQISKQT